MAQAAPPLTASEKPCYRFLWFFVFFMEFVLNFYTKEFIITNESVPSWNWDSMLRRQA
jgi:hypothetical protein